MTTVAAREQSRLVVTGLAGLTLVLTAVFLIAHFHYPGLPAAGTETGGWRGWADQSRYIEAARAWAAWDLTPARHWYPPGYPLMGAPFLRITPHDRFLLPDLACLIASQFACAALARRMFPHSRFASLWGAAAFLVASIGTLSGLKSWLVPWTTTPAAALTFAAFVAVLRLAERPGIGRALLAGGAVGGMIFFRPGDAAPVALAAVVALTPRLVAMRIRTAAGVAVASVLAAAAVSGVAAAIIAATSGFGPDTYYAVSARFGFEFRLLPLRWVSLIIDARPLLDGAGTDRVEPGQHRGLAEVFPWIIAGVGGVAACWFGREEKRVHVLLATWLAAHLALMLCYRDLHIPGFWLYGNYHYFKVTQPVFLLFALLLAVRLADRATRWRAAAAATVAIVLLFGWRASLAPMPGQLAGEQLPAGLLTGGQLPAATSGGVAIPSLESLDDAAIVPGTGTWSAFYYRANVLTINGTQFSSPHDFMFYPRSIDFLLVPLRPLPPHPGVLTVAEGLHVAQGVPAVKVRQAIEFGLPCAFGLAGRAVCGSLGAPLIPSP
ncbi:MAG TPA: hypothetical protein VGL95_12750 [Acetobacteraceae bacterium]|jgi:hypothetical protein